MKRTFILISILVVVHLCAAAQKGLNVATFFSDTYGTNPDVTIVNMIYDKPQPNGVTKYRSIAVAGNPELADRIRRAVTRDGAKASSKEVSYREGDLYFGFYSMGGKGKNRRYLLFLNRRPKGIEKTTLIFIEGDLGTNDVKSLIRHR